MPYDLFLAHASADKDRARALHAALQPDVRVFLDCVSLLPGDHWSQQLPKAQRDSLATVILVSRNAEMAFYLSEEIHTAIALFRAHPGEHRAIPVYLDGAPRDPMELPYGLRPLHGIDLPAEGGMAGVATRLRELVTRLRSQAPPEMPAPIPSASLASGTPPAAASPAPQPPSGPTNLYERLCQLSESQFEALLFYANLPRAHIRPATVPLAQRALDVVMMVQQDGPEKEAWIVRALGDELGDEENFRPHLAQALGKLAPPPLADAAAKWLAYGLGRHAEVHVHGFRDQHRIRLPLDRVFVPLAMDLARQDRGLPGYKDAASLGGHSSVTLDEALACLARTERAVGLILLGDPGAGKTTLLKYLFCRAARGEFTGALAHLRDLYPVLLRLAQITDEELQQGLVPVLERVARAERHAEAIAPLLASQRRFLFLLDGLDEVRDEATRRRICRWLNDEVYHWPGSYFIATSRFAAWQRTPEFDTHFLPVVLRSLDRAAVTNHVQRWFLAVERAYGGHDPEEQIEARAAERAAALLAMLFDARQRAHQRLAEMTGNPLLLSTLCLLYYRDRELPQKRAELYRRTLGLLLETRPSERAGGKVWSSEDVGLALQPLAYLMHERELREIATDEALACLDESLAEVQALQGITPADFLAFAADECGVLMSRDFGRYEFFHLSFQEYLSAAHVAGRDLGAALAGRTGDPRWEEVILLAMSWQAVFRPFMERILERGGARTHATLLRQCLGEAARLDPAPFLAALERVLGRPDSPAVRDELRALLELVRGFTLRGLPERVRVLVHHPDAAIAAAARALAGDVEEVAWSALRPGVPFVEPKTGMCFLWIPPGRFLMGSSMTPGQPGYDPAAFEGETPAHLVTITRGFFLGEHPVTNAQYRRYLEANAVEPPAYFSDRRFSDPEQPVVGVSWEEARRFAAWLSTELAAAGMWRFGLPTEAEWEYAARGSDGRRYPWGNEEPTTERAHFGETWGSGRPSPIGRHLAGKSPFDCQDMAGNVWEWCLDVWQASYGSDQAVVDPCHPGDTRGAARVVRGGSWLLNPWYLRSAIRDGYHPLYRDPDLGFRLVCRGSREHWVD